MLVAGLRRDGVAAVHPAKLVTPERRANLRVRRRRVIRRRHPRRSRPSTRVGARGAAADGRAGRSAARGRAGELAHTRRPHGVQRRRAAQRGQARGLGRLRLRRTRLLEQLLHRQRRRQHRRGRRRHEAVGRALLGAMFDYSENKADYGGTASSCASRWARSTRATADGPWYVGASLGAGGLDYSTTRNITLGAATRSESGDTSGSQFVGRLVGGLLVHGRRLDARPEAEAHLPGIKVTSSRRAAAAHVDDLRPAEARVARHQPRLAGIRQDRCVRPFARVTWDTGKGRQPRA